MSKEELNDLEVLFTQLLVDSEYLYTLVLVKIKAILIKYVTISFASGYTILDYATLKSNLYIDLKVGISNYKRRATIPYISSEASDNKKYQEEAKYRFQCALFAIHQMDEMYGALTNTNQIRYEL